MNLNDLISRNSDADDERGSALEEIHLITAKYSNLQYELGDGDKDCGAHHLHKLAI